LSMRGASCAAARDQETASMRLTAATNNHDLPGRMIPSFSGFGNLFLKK
jgi:hypothetical protein